MKGWELGTTTTTDKNIRVVCCNVKDQYYALQGECPRCGFDLWKGDLITDDSDVWDELPRVACPTCSTTYSMKTGQYGPPIKRTGLQNFVSNLAKTATSQEANKNAKTYSITIDKDDGNIYYRST
jgi:nitrite reductase/ring-hydroxylating ferredoxin subunit